MIQWLAHRPNCRRFIAAQAILAVSGICASGFAFGGSYYRLTITPGQYAIGSERFVDIAGVEAWLRTRDSRVAAIDRCAFTPTRRLVAAIERLDAYAGEVLEIRTVNFDAARCALATSWMRGDDSGSCGTSTMPRPTSPAAA
jgi:hypothetical protein